MAYNPEYRAYKLGRRRYWLSKYKTSKGCLICGYNAHPAALHFDHLEPANKEMRPSISNNVSLKKQFAEIRKCRILCANCHAIHTVEQRHHVRRY